MTYKEFIKELQRNLNSRGEYLVIDGDPGKKTTAALAKYNAKISLKTKKITPLPGPIGVDKSPPWYKFAQKFKGKKETDKEFAAFMVPKWKLVGLNLKTIAKNWAAWCGLAMAVALTGVGMDHAANGARAKNWAQYGIEINYKVDGIPQGAIVHINNAGKCKSSKSNHVAQANGHCTARYLNSAGATIDLYGGNQGNTWKVSTYRVSKICAVRWPKDYKKPGRVKKSHNCSSKNPSGDSTR